MSPPLLIVIFGCTDNIACNYNSEANLDNEGCLYANVGYDCDGNCLNDADSGKFLLATLIQG